MKRKAINLQNILQLFQNILQNLARMKSENPRKYPLSDFNATISNEVELQHFDWHAS